LINRNLEDRTKIYKSSYLIGVKKRSDPTQTSLMQTENTGMCYRCGSNDNYANAVIPAINAANKDTTPQ